MIARLKCAPRCRLADFQRSSVKITGNADRAAMAGTALNHFGFRIGHELEHFGCFLADILSSGMACHMQRHTPFKRLQPLS